MSLKIELLNKDGIVKSEAMGDALVEFKNDSYESGDSLRFITDEKYVWINLHETVKEAMLYIPDGVYNFAIPEGEGLRGFAQGTFEGEQKVTMRVANKEDLGVYRNLCLNPLDFRFPSEVVDHNAPEWSNPNQSAAIDNGEVLGFPHAYANRVTRNEGCFYARNAIDGMTKSDGHGNYPYHSWGGAVHEDLTYAVYFGREVEIDKLVLYLRSDYALDDVGREHDTYWHTALIEFSDGFSQEINPKKSADGQEFDFGKHKTEWLKLSRLDPLQHDGSLNFAALTEIELWGIDV